MNKEQQAIFKLKKNCTSSEIDYFSPAVCEYIIKSKRYNISVIPKEFHTEELCLLALAKKVTLTSKIFIKDLGVLNEKIYQECVRLNPRELKHIPEEFVTQEMVQQVLDELSLYNVPKKYITHEICLCAVKKHGYNLLNIPQEMKSYEIYLTSLITNGAYIKDVPLEMRTYELCLTAVTSFGKALKHVPNDIKTYEMYLKAVTRDPRSIKFIPQNEQTEELVLLAFQSIEKYLERREISISNKTVGKILKYTNIHTHKIYLYLIEKKIFYLLDKDDVLEFYKGQMELYQELCLKAVNICNGKIWQSAIQCIPKKYITREMCDIAIKKDIKNLRYIPRDLDAYEIYEHYMKMHPETVIEFIENPSLHLFSIYWNSGGEKYIPDSVKKLLDDRKNAFQSLHEYQYICERDKLPFLNDDVIKCIMEFITFPPDNEKYYTAYL